MFYKSARRVAIAVVGFTVVLIGLALIVLPGPAIVVIPAGLAILAVEFAWAGRLLKKLKSKTQDMYNTIRGNEAGKLPTAKADAPASSNPH